ncbi:MAG: CV_2116 domain-containing protein [Gemmatimonadales bacterium]
MQQVVYKGFAIMARTYQIRGSGRWTEDLLICHRDALRSFSGPDTYPPEALAEAACFSLGRRIIDGKVPDCTVAGLS